MKLYEYSNDFAELFDSFDEICGYEPQKNENDEYIDDCGNVIENVEEYKKELLTAWFDTLTGIEGEFDLKAENIACYIKQLDGELEMLKKEKAAFEKRRKSKENQLDSLKKYLLDCMKKTNRTKIDMPKAKISIRNNTESVKISNEDKFVSWADKNYKSLLRYKPDINKTAIKDALKKGEKIPDAVLERKQSLIIK